MPEFILGAVTALLFPGLMAYCALYGVFSNNGSGAQPPPPDAKSVQSLTIILIGSVAIHATTALVIALAYAIGSLGSCGLSFHWLGDRGGYYETLRGVIKAKDATRGTIAYLLLATCLQGAVTYALVRRWLNDAAERNDLPVWLYGWTARFVSQLDDDTRAVIAVVLTDTDVPNADGTNRTVAYAGTVRDLKVDASRKIEQIGLVNVERYLIDLSAPLTGIAPAPLGLFQFMLIEGPHIRNITLEVFDPSAVPTVNP